MIIFRLLCHLVMVLDGVDLLNAVCIFGFCESFTLPVSLTPLPFSVLPSFAIFAPETTCLPCLVIYLFIFLGGDCDSYSPPV